MAIYLRLAEVMAERKVSSTDLAKAIGMTKANLSIMRHKGFTAIRYERLDALCRHLDCQPGDLLVYSPDTWPDEGALARTMRTADDAEAE